jgi:hypothetical protein
MPGLPTSLAALAPRGSNARPVSMRAPSSFERVRDSIVGAVNPIFEQPAFKLLERLRGGWDDPAAMKMGVMPVGPGKGAFQLQGLMEDALSGRGAAPALEVVGQGGLNASGESAASLEALSRLASEKAAGLQRVRMGPGGQVTPLIGPDAVDIMPQAREAIGYLQDGVFKLLQGGAGWKG